nr:hypothetical protein Ade03nite_38030 [Actinoplanes derwentensis]
MLDEFHTADRIHTLPSVAQGGPGCGRVAAPGEYQQTYITLLLLAKISKSSFDDIPWRRPAADR